MPGPFWKPLLQEMLIRSRNTLIRKNQKKRQEECGAGKLTERYRHTLAYPAGVVIALLVLILVVRVVTFLLPAVLAVAAVLFVLSYFKKR